MSGNCYRTPNADRLDGIKHWGGGGREGKRKGEKHVKAFFSSCQFIGTFTAHSIKDRQMGGGGTNSRPDLC